MSRHSEDSQVLLDALDVDEPPEPTAHAEVVVKGRNVEIPDHFRIYVAEKLARLERFDRTIYLFDVELDHERNRRQRKRCQHVEITARGRGPVVRGECCGNSFYAALEGAVTKLEARLRRHKDRRKVHYGDKTPVSVAQATKGAVAAQATKGAVAAQPATVDAIIAEAFSAADTVPHDHDGREVAGPDHEPGRIVRTKEHPSTPMTVDDALSQMELVGHDFFLFHDKHSDKPCVVYRRHAYHYGLIRLA